MFRLHLSSPSPQKTQSNTLAHPLHKNSSGWHCYCFLTKIDNPSKLSKKPKPDWIYDCGRRSQKWSHTSGDTKGEWEGYKKKKTACLQFVYSSIKNKTEKVNFSILIYPLNKILVQITPLNYFSRFNLYPDEIFPFCFSLYKLNFKFKFWKLIENMMFYVKKK